MKDVWNCQVFHPAHPFVGTRERSAEALWACTCTRHDICANGHACVEGGYVNDAQKSNQKWRMTQEVTLCRKVSKTIARRYPAKAVPQR